MQKHTKPVFCVSIFYSAFILSRSTSYTGTVARPFSMKTKHKLSILSETLLSKETVVCPEQYKQSVVSDKKAFRILVYSWRFINPAVCQGRIVKLESDGQRIVFTKTKLYTRVTDISLQMTVTTTTGATTTVRLSVENFEKLPLNDKTPLGGP